MRERSPKAKKVWLSILVVSWPFVCTSVHTSVATLISMLWSTDSCQNKVFADQYHMTVLQVQFSTHQVYVFFLSYPLDFNWSQAQLQMDFFAMVTSLLLEVNYKFISGSFGRKPWLNLFYIKGGGGSDWVLEAILRLSSTWRNVINFEKPALFAQRYSF